MVMVPPSKLILPLQSRPSPRLCTLTVPPVIFREAVRAASFCVALMASFAFTATAFAATVHGADYHSTGSALESGQIRTDAAVEIFSQTTKSPAEYAAICNLLRERMPDPSLLTVHETICSQVAMRHERMQEFAAAHDVIIFVSGRASSNGQVLSDLCRKVNPRTHLIGGPGELKPEWFSEGDSVGVCGATSTPKWLLEEVARAVV